MIDGVKPHACAWRVEELGFDKTVDNNPARADGLVVDGDSEGEESDSDAQHPSGEVNATKRGKVHTGKQPRAPKKPATKVGGRRSTVELDPGASDRVSLHYMLTPERFKDCAITPKGEALARMRGECAYDSELIKEVAKHMGNFTAVLAKLREPRSATTCEFGSSRLS